MSEGSKNSSHMPKKRHDMEAILIIVVALIGVIVAIFATGLGQSLHALIQPTIIFLPTPTPTPVSTVTTPSSSFIYKVQIVEGDGGSPITNATVSLLLPDNSELRARTDNSGVVFFTFSEKYIGEEGKLTVELIEKSPLVYSASLNPQQQTIRIPITVSSSQTPTPTTEIVTTLTPVIKTPLPTTAFATSATAVGKLEITYPMEMVVDKDDVITIEVRTDPKLTSIGPPSIYGSGVLSIEVHSEDGPRSTINQEIKLYPDMSAELITSGFELANENNKSNWVTLTKDNYLVWTWSILPKKSGVHKFTINIYGKITENEKEAVILQQSITKNIVVNEKPVLIRFFDSLIGDVPAIIGTGGPLGLIIAFLTYKISNDDKKQKETIESLEKTIGDLESRIRELEQQSRRPTRRT